jgi:hypothetical protein
VASNMEAEELIKESATTANITTANESSEW